MPNKELTGSDGVAYIGTILNAHIGPRVEAALRGLGSDRRGAGQP